MYPPTSPSVTTLSHYHLHPFPCMHLHQHSTITMPHFHIITEKWKQKGKLLRSIIRSTLLPKFKSKFKLFNIHKHNNNMCREDDVHTKQSSSSSSASVQGFLPFLIRVPSRGLKKIGRAVSMGRLHQEDDGGGSLELCKKRIMMGRKCRALSVSGALRYDNNGVLVPEYFPSPSNNRY